MTADGQDLAGATPDDPLSLLDASFTRHRGAALAVARHVLGDAHLAEDAVQLAFLQILVRVRNGDTGLLRTNPRAVVLHGTRWAALKLVERDRDRHAALPLFSGAAGVEGSDPWEHLEARLISDGIVAALPAHYRDALVLRYLEDQPDERAAARLALTVKAYRRRLDRARAAARVSAARTAGAVLGLGGARRALRLRGWQLRADARLRQIRARLAHIFGGPGWTHWVVVVAIVSVSVGVSAPFDKNLATPALSPNDVQPAGPLAVAAHPLVSPPSDSANGPQHRGMPTGTGPMQSRASGSSALLPLFNPPPPSDVTVLNVDVAPQYDRTHALIIDGAVSGCTCSALYQSTDGGATWTSWVPPVNGKVVLPPAYPDDPQIMVVRGNDEPACIMAHFGANLCTPLPVMGLAGFGARFDNGRPVVYGMGVTGTGFVAYDVATQTLRPIVLGLNDSGQQVITPSSPVGPDIYLVDSGTSMAGPVQVGRGPDGFHIMLFACDVNLACALTSTDHLGLGSVDSDREDPTAAVLAGVVAQGTNSDTFGVSLDQGRTFRLQIDMPLGVHESGWGFQEVGAGQDMAVYELNATDGGPESLVRVALDGSREPLTLPQTVRGDWISVVALSTRRLLAYAATGSPPGFWCSVDGGHTWLRGCPAQG